MSRDDRVDLLSLLEEAGALRHGHFMLSSGRHSADYVQCALLLQMPSQARRIGRALSLMFEGIDIESVVAPALGGLLIGHEVAAALDVPLRFTERLNRLMTLRRGFSFRPGERVLLIEDVVTTGKSTRETIAVVESAGARVVAVGSMIDRTGGADTFDVPFLSLLELGLETFDADECPLCRDGRALESPGSRHS